MAYCSIEATQRALRGDERKAFMLACTGLSIRADRFAFTRCKAQSVGLEGKEFLDSYKGCLFSSGARSS